MSSHATVSNVTCIFRICAQSQPVVELLRNWCNVLQHGAILILLLAVGCKVPRRYVEVPEPTAKNVWLAWDGEKLVWLPIVGGPSGALDATSHFGEIELAQAPAAKYLLTPVNYAKDVQPGQLVTYGPATDGQAIQPSGMSAKLLGIERGVLIEGKVEQPPTPSGSGRTILGWTGNTYVAAGGRQYVTWGSLGLAPDEATRAFVMPIAGRLTRIAVSTRTAQPATGTLEFMVRGLKVTVPAGAAAGVYAADNTVNVAGGDLVQVEVVNRATSNSAYVTAVTAVFEY